MKVLFATTNQAKVLKYKKVFEENGIELITIKDLDFSLDIEENGKMKIIRVLNTNAVVTIDKEKRKVIVTGLAQALDFTKKEEFLSL